MLNREYNRWPRDYRDSQLRWRYEKLALQSDIKYTVVLEDYHPPDPFPCSSSNTLSRPVSLKEDWRNGKSDLDCVYDTLISCPNLRSLSLEISSSGCLQSEKGHRQFSFRDGDHFPPLLNLRLLGYEWDNLEASDINLPTKSPSQEFKEAFDLSNLKDLEISLPRSSFLSTFHNQLPNLSSITLGPEFWMTETTLCGTDREVGLISKSRFPFLFSNVFL